MTHPITEFPYSVSITENEYIPNRQGVKLAAKLWVPNSAQPDEKVPAVLEFLPYRKADGTPHRDALTHPYLAGHGIATVRCDLQGSGDSEGTMIDEYTEQEMCDAEDVIAWIARQPWCNGNVAMMGISWGGFNALQLAFRQPPALKAILTLCSSVDRYNEDIHYKGGCLLNENVGWSSTMLAYSSLPPDPVTVGVERWLKMWHERLEVEPLLAHTWLSHQTRDAYWKHGSVIEDMSRIKIPVFAAGGWYDSYTNAIGEIMTSVPAPTFAIVGPWIHKYPHFASPGPRTGFLQEARRFIEASIGNRADGCQAMSTQVPRYRIYVMKSEPPKPTYTERAGFWAENSSYPFSTTREIHYLMASGELSGTALDPCDAPVGTNNAPMSVGTQAGEYCPIWSGPDLPCDQRQDDAFSLCFDTLPLDSLYTIIGRVEVKLRFRVSHPVAKVAVRLNDVFPTGEVSRITYCVMNLCQYGNQEHPEELIPGKVYEATALMDDIAYQVSDGHRLRVSMSSAYWPLIWPSPERCEVTLLQGSSVTLPRAEALTPCVMDYPVPESAPSIDVPQLQPPSNSRKFSHEMHGGTHHLDIEDSFGEYRFPCGIASGGIGREYYTIKDEDANSASLRTHWTLTTKRAEPLEWDTRTETYCEMTSTKSEFILTARIEAYESGDKLIFQRDFKEVLPRICQ